MTMRGDICLYQGEELGLPQAEVPYERLQDSFGKTFWPKFKGRDGCRTPMPWNGQAHGGFSPAEPWLPVDDTHLAMNVEQQESDRDSVLNLARKLIALRKARPELRQGAIELLDAPEGVLAFRRTYEGKALVCLFNMDGVEKEMQAPAFSAVTLAQNAVAQTQRVRLGVSGFCLLEGR